MGGQADKVLVQRQRIGTARRSGRCVCCWATGEMIGGWDTDCQSRVATERAGTVGVEMIAAMVRVWGVGGSSEAE